MKCSKCNGSGKIIKRATPEIQLTHYETKCDNCNGEGSISLEEAANNYANEFCSNDSDLIEKYWDIVHDVFKEGAIWVKDNNY